jgi:DNA-binding transcriptional MerR regulator
MEKKIKNKLIRMKKLSEETGVPKGTIQFYIKEGLIPRPIKTHQNMAYYDENHLDAIRMIKELQSKRFLPLSVIRQIMGGKKDLTIEELKTVFAMDGNLFKHLEEKPKIKPVMATKLCEWTGVPLKEIKELEKYGILHPSKKGNRMFYDEDDVRLVEIWAKVRKAGFTKALGFDTEVVKILKDAIDGLVEEEARIVLRRIAGKVPPEKVVKMADDALQLGTTLMELLIRKAVLEFARKYAKQYRESIK